MASDEVEKPMIGSWRNEFHQATPIDNQFANTRDTENKAGAWGTLHNERSRQLVLKTIPNVKGDAVSETRRNGQPESC